MTIDVYTERTSLVRSQDMDPDEKKLSLFSIWLEYIGNIKGYDPETLINNLLKES